MKKKKYIFATVLILLICAVGAGIGFTASATVDDNIICDGVYIDSVNISKMTAAEAKEAVDAYADNLKSKKITIKVDEKKITTTFEKLGYDYAVNDYIEQALMVGKSGNIIKRYKELKDIEKEKLVYQLDFLVDEDAVKNIVENECSSFNIDSKNATIKRKDGKFIVTNHKTGRKVVTDETIEKIKSAMLNDWDQKNLTIDAIVIDDEPKYTKEIVEKCDTLIGNFSTTYASSSQSRAANLANGADLLDGTVLFPDEVLSCYAILNPFTEDNGYYTAGAYSQGMVVDSIGGGICQVSSTLYNAAILAELEIVERSPHSMAVSYVPLSRDAAIAGTYKDLKFKNNTDAPIYIESYTVGRTISFNIYGDETREQGRKVQFETVIKKEIAPPEDVVTEDKTKPTTYTEVTQSAHIGYKAELYKVVYQDGVEVSRTLFNSSSYAAAPNYVTIGKKEDDKDKDKEKILDKNLDKGKEDISAIKDATTKETEVPDIKATKEPGTNTTKATSTNTKKEISVNKEKTPTPAPDNLID